MRLSDGYKQSQVEQGQIELPDREYEYGSVSQERPEVLASEPCLHVSPWRITRVLGLIVLVLLSLHVVLMGLYSRYPPGDDARWSPLRFLSTLFDLNAEANPPAWYSSSALLACACLLGIIAFARASRRQRYARHWMVLAAIFLYLSADEASRLHDRTVIPLRSMLALDGFFYYSWVILAIPILLLFAVLYARFLLALPGKIRLLFMLAGATYVSGAIGVEMVTGYVDHLRDGFVRTDMLFIALVALEEGAEMVGVLIFLHALMVYIQSQVGAVRFRFDP